MKALERAPAKVNLVLHVGALRSDGLHPLCSLLASLDLADEVAVEARGAEDAVVCPGVEGENLALEALRTFRSAAPDAALPALRVTIEKHVPVAAGLGGGSADAAAALRAANELAGRPLGETELRRIGASLGSDVPSQVEPGGALVTDVGETVERVRLPPMALVLVPQARGLSTAEVYRELDRLRAAGEAPPRARLDPGPVRRLAEGPLEALAASLENDLERAAVSLRPELVEVVDALRRTGALGAAVTGSGPTTFGVFPDRAAAKAAARRLPGSIVAEAR